MSNKITSMTPEQEMDLLRTHEEAFLAGTTTKPTNRPRMEDLIAKIYKTQGLARPEMIWVRSPMEAATYLADGGPMTNEVISAVLAPAWGPSNLYWTTYYKFGAKLGVEYDAQDAEELEDWDAVAREGFWWWPFEHGCIICERPDIIQFDASRTVLHSENGPAIRFTDGYSLYMWRGTPVPAEWIEDKENLDPRLALTHQNVEMRAIVAQIVGWRKVLDLVKSRVIDQDHDPEVGTLLEVDLPDAPGSRFLQVRCGTGRDFVLPVPSTMKTALEANAWTYNVPPEMIRGIVRT